MSLRAETKGTEDPPLSPGVADKNGGEIVFVEDIRRTAADIIHPSDDDTSLAAGVSPKSEVKPLGQGSVIDFSMDAVGGYQKKRSREEEDDDDKRRQDDGSDGEDDQFYGHGEEQRDGDEDGGLQGSAAACDACSGSESGGSDSDHSSDYEQDNDNNNAEREPKDGAEKVAGDSSLPKGGASGAQTANSPAKRDFCAVVECLAETHPLFKKTVQKSVETFFRQHGCAQRMMSWTIPPSAVNRVRDIANSHHLAAVFLDSETAGGSKEIRVVLRHNHLPAERNLRREIVVVKKQHQLHESSGNVDKKMFQWTFAASWGAALAAKLLSSEGASVLPTVELQTYQQQSIFVVRFGWMTSKELDTLGAQENLVMATKEAGGSDVAVVKPQSGNTSAASGSAVAASDIPVPGIPAVQDVPQWLRPFYVDKIAPFLRNPMNRPPLRLMVLPQYQIPVNKIKEIPNVVRAVRYEASGMVGGRNRSGGTTTPSSFFLRRSMRTVVEHAVRAVKVSPSTFSFDVLLEQRFLTTEITELAKTQLYLYAARDRDCVRIRGFSAAKPELVREGHRLICLPFQRLILNADEHRELHSLVKEFLKNTTMHHIKLPFPVMMFDDVTLALKNDFTDQVDAWTGSNDICVRRSPNHKVLASVKNALSDWADSGCASGSLAFRVDDVFEADVSHRVKSFAGVHNIRVDRSKEDRVVTFTLTVPGHSTQKADEKRPQSQTQSDPRALQPAPTAAAALPLPPPTPPVQEQTLDPYHYFPRGKSAMFAGISPKDLYNSIAQGQSQLPSGFTCRLVPQRSQLVLLDHVKRQGFRSETGEVLALFGTSIANGVQSVRAHLDQHHVPVPILPAPTQPHGAYSGYGIAPVAPQHVPAAAPASHYSSYGY